MNKDIAFSSQEIPDRVTVNAALDRLNDSLARFYLIKMNISILKARQEVEIGDLDSLNHEFEDIARDIGLTAKLISASIASNIRSSVDIIDPNNSDKGSTRSRSKEIVRSSIGSEIGCLLVPDMVQGQMNNNGNILLSDEHETITVKTEGGSQYGKRIEGASVHSLHPPTHKERIISSGNIRSNSTKHPGSDHRSSRSLIMDIGSKNHDIGEGAVHSPLINGPISIERCKLPLSATIVESLVKLGIELR